MAMVMEVSAHLAARVATAMEVSARLAAAVAVVAAVVLRPRTQTPAPLEMAMSRWRRQLRTPLPQVPQVPQDLPAVPTPVTRAHLAMLISARTVMRRPWKLGQRK